ncbi:MAG: hypothetical protein EB153_08710 [Nitrosopumilaceae archaeon]|nr:hypothetical protein [Nitrosopumilaceae archaeon]
MNSFATIMIIILGLLVMSIFIFMAQAEGAGLVWRAINKAGSSLFDIADVAFTNCSNGNVLQYQTSNSTWVCVAPSGIASINSQSGSSQTFAGTANNVTISSSSNTHTFNLGSNVVTTGGSDQTITKGLTINSGTLGGSLNANSQRITSLGTPTASTDAEPANRMGLLGNKVINTCMNNQILQYRASNSTWICSELITRVSGASGAAGNFTTWQTLSSDASAITSTTPSAVMTTTGVDTGTWHYKYVVIYQTAATTTGLFTAVDHTGTVSTFTMNTQFQSTGGAAATQITDGVNSVQNAGLVEGKSERVKNTATSATAGVDTANTNVVEIVEGIVIVTASGDLQLKIGTEVAASGVTVKAGTLLELNKIA